MKTRAAQGALGATALCLACAAHGQSREVQAPLPIVATIDTQQTAPPVSKYEFGMFIEHIRTLIYRSLWSEMLDDRKFYFPISSKEPDAPAPQSGGPFRNMQLRKWRPVGADEVVVTDKDQPFVGDQSPRVELDSARQNVAIAHDTRLGAVVELDHCLAARQPDDIDFGFGWRWRWICSRHELWYEHEHEHTKHCLKLHHIQSLLVAP